MNGGIIRIRFLGLGIFWLGTRVVFHSCCPLQEAEQLMTRAPHEGPEFEKTNFVHLDASVGLDSPTQIWAPPRHKAMAASCDPHEVQNSFHDLRLS